VTDELFRLDGMKKKKIVFYLLLFSTCVFSQPTTTELNHGMELSICGQYDQALTFFDKLDSLYPENVQVSFFRAAVWQSRIMDFETSQWEKEFFEEISRTVRLARTTLKKNPDDIHARFFLGAALSYQSFQLARDKKYISAFQVAMRSYAELRKVNRVDSSFCDTYLGIGSYQYWRSQLTRKLAWLPFFSDDRESGIRQIQKAFTCGIYSKWAALSNLAWIYIEEKNYTAAVECAAQGLEHFPHSRFFFWPMGDARFKNNDSAAAKQIYTELLESVRAESLNNHYNEILLLYKLAQCDMSTGDLKSAQKYCEEGLAIPEKGEAVKRIANKKKKIIELLKEINGRGSN
jgi:tetratricopeptide (TPR) repeat protein